MGSKLQTLTAEVNSLQHALRSGAGSEKPQISETGYDSHTVTSDTLPGLSTCWPSSDSCAIDTDRFFGIGHPDFSALTYEEETLGRALNSVEPSLNADFVHR